LKCSLAHLAGRTAASGAATHANAVRRPSHLDDLHADFRGALLAVALIHLAEASGEEDWLDPLASLAASCAQRE